MTPLAPTASLPLGATSQKNSPLVTTTTAVTPMNLGMLRYEAKKPRTTRGIELPSMCDHDQCSSGAVRMKGNFVAMRGSMAKSADNR
jgi:hypothetical protein